MTPKPLRPLWILLLAIAGWMLAAHPYWGVWHDGTLYFGQVLLHTRAPQLAQDLFFASGSQDRYSVYSLVMAPLYGLFGPHATHVLAVLMSWVAMGAGVLALLRSLTPRPSAWSWGLLAFAVTSPIYGGGWVFGYGEPFLTARTVAEPLLIWSLVAVLHRRHVRMVALLAAAGAFHPLMTLPMVVVAACHLAQCDRRWLGALAVLPVAAFAGAADIAPWDRLLQRFDAPWWSMIDAVSAYVLPHNWSALDGMAVAIDLTVVGAVARLRPADDFARLLRATMIAAVLLLGACLILAEGLRLVLPTQLQLWRVHWIVHLLAVVLAPWLVARFWSLGGFWPVSACALVLVLLTLHARSPHAAVAIALWLATTVIAWRAGGVSGLTVRIACSCIGIVVVTTAVTHLGNLLALQGWQAPEAGWGGLWLLGAGHPAIALPAFAGLCALQRRGAAGRAVAGISILAFFFTVAWQWDQRTDLARATENSGADHPFQAHVPRDATVYWPGQLAPVWGMLERTSHFAPQQGSGMLFHRHNALSFGERRETYRGISEDYARCRNGALLARDREALSSCEQPSTPRLQALCATTDHPGFIVLPRPLATPPLATWQLPVHREPPQVFALYACRQLAPQP